MKKLLFACIALSSLCTFGAVTAHADDCDYRRPVHRDYRECHRPVYLQEYVAPAPYYVEPAPVVRVYQRHAHIGIFLPLPPLPRF